MTTTPAETLTAIVKTYDVRGLVGSQLTEELVTALGAGFVDELGAAGGEIVVGHDMRDSSPSFAQAFARGATARGGNVLLIGLCSTDETYFASGSLDAPAVMFTASHNRHLQRPQVLPRGRQGISLDTGLGAIRDRAIGFLADGIAAVEPAGQVRERDVLADYAGYLRQLVDLSGIRPLRVVVDAGNGMGA